MVCWDRIECMVAQQLIQNCSNILTSILHLSAYMPMIHNIATFVTVKISGPHLIIYCIIQVTVVDNRPVRRRVTEIQA